MIVKVQTFSHEALRLS